MSATETVPSLTTLLTPVTSLTLDPSEVVFSWGEAGFGVFVRWVRLYSVCG